MRDDSGSYDWSRPTIAIGFFQAKLDQAANGITATANLKLRAPAVDLFDLAGAQQDFDAFQFLVGHSHLHHVLGLHGFLQSKVCNTKSRGLRWALSALRRARCTFGRCLPDA